MTNIKWRTWGKGMPPRQIKLEIPGWAGEHKLHEDGCSPQPWHCLPFVEGSTYGLELIYPFDAETRVINDGEIKFSGPFTKEECHWSDPPSPPFSNFAPGHYGHTSCIDLLIPEDHIIRLEPHPRFFTDITGECPIAVPGHIQSWWPKIFFVVFKAPALGQTHVFRKGEAYAQILILPKKQSYSIEEMSPEEKLKRQNLETNIGDLKDFIKKKSWKDSEGHQFDDKYKQLSSAFSKEGPVGIERLIGEADRKRKNKSSAKIIGKFVKR